MERLLMIGLNIHYLMHLRAIYFLILTVKNTRFKDLNLQLGHYF